ncbi:MAG: hypothetical protein M0Q88_02735 [Bacilli bacterium]|nr:hypothetical protein [Bacilli bacterium]
MRGKKYEINDRVNFFIKKDASENLLNWLNSQRNVSHAITEVLEKYVNKELVDIAFFNKFAELSKAFDLNINNSENINATHETKVDNREQPGNRVEVNTVSENKLKTERTISEGLENTEHHIDKSTEERNGKSRKTIPLTRNPIFASENSVKSKFVNQEEKD